ncbi:MAG: Hsp33 family molecular chaperone [Rhizobiaceae bacterium]|nr:Hsp33 family molecular chaperone [Rhizobiaceae bacterium]
MNEQNPTLGDFGFAGDDNVVPFDVETLDVRGRAVQLGPLLDQVLGRHDYPEPVANLLAEAIVLTVLLGTSLKFDGKFILQTRSDGPVDMLVADIRTPGSVRAYARYDADLVEAAIAEGRIAPEQLLGTGVLALTVDQGSQMQRYQGVVELDGTSLEDIARVYFRQSEQIPTEVRLGVARQHLPGQNGSSAHWRAGGALMQFLPQSLERMRVPDLHGGDGDDSEQDQSGPPDDAWQTARALFLTLDPSELADPTVGTERLLYRVFHEQGVRVYDGTPVVDDCSCSRDKIRQILDGFTAEEIEESTEDGVIKVNCEFCSTEYEFDPAEFGDAEAASGRTIN